MDIDFTIQDLYEIIPSELKRHSMVHHHVESFNKLFDETTDEHHMNIQKVISNLFHIKDVIYGNEIIYNVKEDHKDYIKQLEYEFVFTNVKVSPYDEPIIFNKDPKEPTPNNCRLYLRTYSRNLVADLNINLKVYTNESIKEKAFVRKNLTIASIPIMVGSNLCKIIKKTRDEKIAMGEDPSDQGGYFIIKGKEWSIDSIQSILYNFVHVKKEHTKNELVRGFLISKIGDGFENSYETKFRILNDYSITMELVSSKLEKIQIPFYVIYYMLGVTSDKDIVESISCWPDNDNDEDSLDIKQKIIEILKKAFHNENSMFDELKGPISLNRSEMFKFIVNRVYSKDGKEVDQSRISEYITNIESIIDRQYLSQMGNEKKDRLKKAKLTGIIIRRLIFNLIGLIEDSDRNSMKNLRIQPSGYLYVRSFKKNLNVTIINPSIKRLRDALVSTKIESINIGPIIESCFKTDELKRLMNTSIATGNKFVVALKKILISNKIISQEMHRKNHLDTLATANVINTNHKITNNLSSTSLDARAVHHSIIGYICPIRSADGGDKVGMARQKTICSHIDVGSSGKNLKKLLFSLTKEGYSIFTKDKSINIDKMSNFDLSKPLPSFSKKKLREFLDNNPNLIKNIPKKDLLIIKINNVDYKDLYRPKVFVNGELIGVLFTQHKEIFNIANYLRNIRRNGINGNIYRKATILVDVPSMDIYCWVDLGRILRPLVIVYENNGKKFVKFNKQIAIAIKQKKMTMEDLETQGIVEYVSAEESENCWICESLDLFKATQNDPLYNFTHLEIPASIIGMNALVSPYLNHSQTQRITMLTNHVKQTCGWSLLSFAFRFDKQLYFQNYCETPIVKTMINDILLSNGQNIILAYTSYLGFNQEDALVINAASVHRGLFTCEFYTFEESAIEEGAETFDDPSIDTDINPNYDYSKLVNGRVRKGTVLVKNDVIICKIDKIIDKVTGQVKIIDKPVVYKYNEVGYVENSFEAENDSGNKFVKVKIRIRRRIIVGDKFSSRSGCKGIVAKVVPYDEMPYTKSGLVPDIIINPHSIPSRMIISQLKESIISKLNLYKGVITDATVFTPINIMDIIRELDELMNDPKLKQCNISKDHMDEFGNETFINPISGEELEAKIFICPAYYQRLQKFVVNSIYAISQGPTNSTTRQPLDGKNVSGGIRIGEMEKDVLLSHGATTTLMDKTTTDSDGFDLYICNNCGQPAIYNLQKKIYNCNVCQENANIKVVPSTWVYNLFNHEKQALGVGVEFGLTNFVIREYLKKK